MGVTLMRTRRTGARKQKSVSGSRFFSGQKIGLKSTQTRSPSFMNDFITHQNMSIGSEIISDRRRDTNRPGYFCFNIFWINLFVKFFDL